MKRRSFLGLLAGLTLLPKIAHDESRLELGPAKGTVVWDYKRDRWRELTINEILGESGNLREMRRLLHGQSPGPNLLGKQTWGTWV